ncbi:M20/M25/M40 family metallo-hydrolase [Terriglobus tenax]|uniref:M20/M25/M40 family metallo-hydrolase n=1 Tax=Terriglobus tenax TaxID=1111115 RepID=UPI0021E03A27|nr:M20/M25/M40 family metallo-hydrolase [Terriglobus tenax]
MKTLRLFVPVVLAASAVAQSGPIADKYKADADKIIAAAMKDTEGYDTLAYLTDHVGKRLSGSDALLKALDWGAETMKKAGFQNVHIEEAMVPHWVRGQEEASITAPFNKPLHMLGLGMSVGTPAEGITAPILFVPDLAALETIPAEQVKGKIVVFNPGWKGYGVGSMHRTTGASRAAAKGAVAVLVRSATGLALQTPHTGTLRYDESQPKIPAAAISVEDALLLERLAKEGEVKVHLKMEAHQEADQKAGNVIGEIPGTEHPEQVVVLGGHIDSWDVGQGAQDDGGGIISCFEAVNLIHKLGLKPKRTLRVVFWVNEENGGSGGRAYLKGLGDSVKNHVAAIESDGGVERPLGIGYTVAGGGAPSASVARRQAGANPSAAAGMAAMMGGPREPDESKLTPEEKKSWETMKQIASLLKPIGADSLTPNGGGSDIGPIVAAGVPSLSPRTVGEHYFDWHHTEADTLDKVDKEDFRKNIALLAVLSYVLADMDGQLVGHHSAAPRE